MRREVIMVETRAAMVEEGRVKGEGSSCMLDGV